MPNIYTPPLYRYFFIILWPLFFATVSIPIRFELRIHPPVEWAHRETKTLTRKRRSQSRTCFDCPDHGSSEFRIKRKGSDWLFCKEAQLSQKVKKVSWRITFCVVYLDFIWIYSQRRCMLIWPFRVTELPPQHHGKTGVEICGTYLQTSKLLFLHKRTRECCYMKHVITIIVVYIIWGTNACSLSLHAGVSTFILTLQSGSMTHLNNWNITGVDFGSPRSWWSTVCWWSVEDSEI